MSRVDILDKLANLTPAGACSILIVLAGVTLLGVGAALLLGQQFSRRTPAQRRDLISLLAALRGMRRSDG